MADNDDAVSKEAFEREQRKAADLEKQLAERDSQLAAASGALSDYQKRDRARSFLKDKVADPDTVADTLTPHLKDVGLDDLDAHFESEGFKQKVSVFREAAQPSETPEQPGGFGGPSPAGDSTAQPLGTKEPVRAGSAEWREQLKNPEAMEAAYKENRVAEPTPPY